MNSNHTLPGHRKDFNICRHTPIKELVTYNLRLERHIHSLIGSFAGTIRATPLTYLSTHLAHTLRFCSHVYIVNFARE